MAKIKPQDSLHEDRDYPGCNAELGENDGIAVATIESNELIVKTMDNDEVIAKTTRDMVEVMENPTLDKDEVIENPTLSKAEFIKNPTVSKNEVFENITMHKVDVIEAIVSQALQPGSIETKKKTLTTKVKIFELNDDVKVNNESIYTNSSSPTTRHFKIDPNTNRSDTLLFEMSTAYSVSKTAFAEGSVSEIPNCMSNENIEEKSSETFLEISLPELVFDSDTFGSVTDMPNSRSDEVQGTDGNSYDIPIESSLEELDFDPIKALVEADDDLPFTKKSFYGSIFEKICRNMHPEFIVYIDDKSVACQTLVLTCLSDKFNTNMRHIVLDSNKVSLDTFTTMYKWMLNENYSMNTSNVVALYIAADDMNITELLAECWAIFENTAVFEKHKALKLLRVPMLEKIMLHQIRYFFLTLVSSSYYKELEFEQIRNLLSSNNIGINVETEVLFAAVLWLNANWKARKQHTIKLLDAVRFDRIPMTMLVALNRGTELGPEMKKVVAIRDVKQKVYSAIAKTTIINCHRKDRNKEDTLKLFPMKLLYNSQDRCRIYDKKCPYHKPKSQITYQKPFHYEDFLEYLSNLRTYGWKHWMTLQPADQVTDLYKSSSLVNLSQTVDRQSRKTQSQNPTKSSIRHKSVDSSRHGMKSYKEVSELVMIQKKESLDLEDASFSQNTTMCDLTPSCYEMEPKTIYLNVGYSSHPSKSSTCDYEKNGKTKE